ncbi:MAG: hypothetical protein JXQ65_16690 [Candidatus Marinimicrobia bacterium]|nr:hypothetical protein [Candidatus Neomarinimicrobiota bacterium]
MNSDECCPKFDPAPWNDHVFEWQDKKFIRGKVFTFFNIPINFGSTMKKLVSKIEIEKGEFPDGLCLSDHTSKWNMDVYLAVDKEMPGAENTTISGKFFSKVYEGPYSATGKWCQDFEAHAKRLDLEIKKWYMWYTTCPKCAKKYGKNYVVIIGQV